MANGIILAEALHDLGLNPRQPANLDIAEANLLCAVGLPGAEGLDVNACLLRLDEIATDVGGIIFSKANCDVFLNNPGAFHNSQAYFCVVCMITVLKTKYGVEYNPKWFHVVPEKPVPDDFGKDAKDQFIHAILNGDGGTCGSLPVFFVAVGRRIGLPVFLVKALNHLFMRWDDRFGIWRGFSNVPAPYKGEVFNVEATGPEIHRLPDEEYRNGWPHPIPKDHLDTGIYLNSMPPVEELAEFLAQRANCFYFNDRLVDSYKALKWCVRLAPHNSIRKARLERLEEFIKAAMDEQPQFYQPVERLPRKQAEHVAAQPAVEKGPRWIQMNDGTRALMQIIRPTHLSPSGSVGTSSSWNVGIALQNCHVQLPNGHNAWAEVPIQTAHQPMAAFWIELSMNEFALVHRPRQGIHGSDSSRIGQPILPATAQSTLWPAHSAMNGGHTAGIRPPEPQRLSQSEENILRSAANSLKSESVTGASTSRLGLPAAGFSPIDFVPTHTHLPSIPHQRGPLLRIQT